MDWNYRRLIRMLYINQKAAVQVNEDLTDWVELGRGVGPGCCLSPTLFNLYIEDMIQNELENRGEGISLVGVKIRCISFADDMVLLAEDTRALQRLLTVLEEGVQANEWHME